MKRISLAIILTGLLAGWAFAPGEDDPWAAWPYRLSLRVTTPELADFSGMAAVRVNLGAMASQNGADVRVLDDKGREQPWQLRSIAPSKEISLLFRTVKGTRNYTLIFGNPAARKPNYGVSFPIGRTIIDDRLPARAHTHGLWEWVTSPVVSGSFSHTSPLKDRPGFHGTSEIGDTMVGEDAVLEQYVKIDPLNPPEQILLRIAFADEPNEGDWRPKQRLILSWGKNNIRGISGTLRRMGDLPGSSGWQRLDLHLSELEQMANIRSRDGSAMHYIYGIDFATDKGRAWWDCTSLGDIPGETEPVGLERASGAKATFAFQRLSSFKLAGAQTVLQEVRFFPAAADKTRCQWDFGDGTKSEEKNAEHVFEGTGNSRVSIALSGPDGKTDAASDDIEGVESDEPAQEYAVELVSCPFIVRSDAKALFNLRIDGAPPKSRDFEACAVLLDADDKEIRRESADVTMLPSDKHPAFKAFSLDVAAPNLSRIRFEMQFHGRPVAQRVVTVYSSLWALNKLKMAGDRFVDASDNPAVIRVDIAPQEAERKPVERRDLSLRVLVVGDLPVGAPGFAERLKKDIESSSKGEATVKKTGVEIQPAWSMPYRQVVATAGEDVNSATDVVLIASASEMVLNGVPARAGVDAIAACVDQLRRRSNAEIILLTPVNYAGFEDLAREYAMGLRLLGIEKTLPVIDVYSRSVRLGDENPELLKTVHVAGGVLVHELQPRLADMVVSTIVSDLLNPAPAIRGNE